MFLQIIFWKDSPQTSSNTALAATAASAAVVQEKTTEAERVRIGLPVRIIIPNIKVNAELEYVGLTPNGEMDVPKERTHAAWFNLGARPGENGSAVIAGHYGWKDGKSSVFDNLNTLHIGDKVYVEDGARGTTIFIVRALKEYNQNTNASDVFNSYDGKSHLNLITCEGVWNKELKNYSKRLVVFTEKE